MITLRPSGERRSTRYVRQRPAPRPLQDEAPRQRHHDADDDELGDVWTGPPAARL
jgi:hypothetical protein